MLKKVISVAISIATITVMSVSVMASDVEVNSGNTIIGANDTLSTSGQYKMVLVVNENANLQNLTPQNIFYIDQAASSAEAFVNIGLKKGQDSKIAEGTYTMYLLDANNTKTSRTIIVSDELAEGEGVAFSAIAGVNGKNPVREQDGKYYTDQGYTVTLDASETPIVGYRLVISCTPEGGSTLTYEVPQARLTSLSGYGTFNIGLQINDIPCTEEGELLASFTPSLIPLY